MNNATAIQTFVELLDHQADLIGQLATHEGSLQEAVSARDWSELEKITPKMAALGEAINTIEEQRNDLFQEISRSVGGDATFARVLQLLPHDVRSELSAAYRRLKVAVLALQSRTAGMDAYIRATIATTRGVLNELYPEQTSRGYTRDGQGRFNTASAVMVDRAH